METKKGEIGKQGLLWWSEHCVVKTYTCETTIHLNAFDSTRRASYSSYTHVCKEPPSKIERRSISAGPDARPSTSHLQSPVGLHFKVGSPAATERRATSASRNIPQHEHSRSDPGYWCDSIEYLWSRWQPHDLAIRPIYGQTCKLSLYSVPQKSQKLHIYGSVSTNGAHSSGKVYRAGYFRSYFGTTEFDRRALLY